MSNNKAVETLLAKALDAASAADAVSFTQAALNAAHTLLMVAKTNTGDL